MIYLKTKQMFSEIVKYISNVSFEKMFHFCLKRLEIIIYFNVKNTNTSFSTTIACSHKTSNILLNSGIRICVVDFGDITRHYSDERVAH